MAKKIKSICHISTVHYGLDSRIFYKECLSSSKAGYATYLIISANKNQISEALDKNVRLHPILNCKNRFFRISYKQINALIIAIKINSNIYHLHDPELLFSGLILLLLGKKVVYDSHEDLALDIQTKTWASYWIKFVILRLFFPFYRYSLKKVSIVISATEGIQSSLSQMNISSEVIHNYPVIEFFNSTTGRVPQNNSICYVGGISLSRGILEMMNSIGLSNTKPRFILCGSFDSFVTKKRMEDLPSVRFLDYRGFLDLKGVKEAMGESAIGMLVLHPTPAYLNSLPIKLFEYMASGLPVIASDFPVWREIVESNGCGILVDPLSAQEIANGVDFLLLNPGVAKEMGKKGREAIIKKYNWNLEEKKLIGLYSKLDKI